ncbi:hypothetical protein GY642_25410, partial [Escherichia coli]|nr:hypothetical protein [Escherichia coli]
QSGRRQRLWRLPGLCPETAAGRRDANGNGHPRPQSGIGPVSLTSLKCLLNRPRQGARRGGERMATKFSQYRAVTPALVEQRAATRHRILVTR